jgi:DNA polymerase/3'-5' exonuclease PolX
MELIKAKEIAIALCYKLQPYCDKINIAGSIRRQKPEVKDIEIICLPKIVELENSDLFGAVTVTKVINAGFVRVVDEIGELVKGKPGGRYMQFMLSQGIKLDLFTPEPHDYYRQFAIRTGSADYSAIVIAYGWKKLGWCGTDKGLRRQSQCTEKKGPDGKSKWICDHPNPDLPPVWESEQEFFNWIEAPYKVPKDRSL